MNGPAIGVVGAGAIGRAHAQTIATCGFATLAGVADPAPQARAFAQEMGIPWFADASSLLSVARPQALIAATPNDLHLPVALAAIAAGVPVLVEKPVTSTIEDGERLVRASREAGVPVLVGHHRRHNPIIARARSLVREGAIGTPTSIAVLSNFYKPEDYFALDWRRRAGAGPVLINMIHEIDLLRFVVGEIVTVQAMTSNARRGFEVEDTAAVLLRFGNGALATISLSDTAASPWAWDLASGELPNYPPQPARVQSHFFTGTEGAFALPTLEYWRYREQRSWFAPISNESRAVERADPYLIQLRHFCAVVRGEATPLIDAGDGLRTLRATLAVHQSARSGAPVHLQEI